MGTRINILIDHDLSDFRDPTEVLARLASTAGATAAVCDYWITANPDHPSISPQAWIADPRSPREHRLRRFTGPGSLSLTATAVAAQVRTGGRWRGFLAIEPMRQVHLLAFRAIAGALGAKSMALYPDSDEVDDLFWGGRTLWECIERMDRMWGPPQDSVGNVNPEIVASAQLYLPSRVWFLEGVGREVAANPHHPS